MNLGTAAPKGPSLRPRGRLRRAGHVRARAAQTTRAFYQDVFWALLNSSEFMLNH